MSNIVKSLNALDDMIGQEFMYNARTFKIKGYISENGHVKIKTDSRDIQVDKVDLDKKLEEFLPVEASLGSSEIRKDAAKLRDLEKKLYDNIDKIEKDKDYIPQAKAVTETATAIMNMEKLKIQMLKAIQ